MSENEKTYVTTKVYDGNAIYEVCSEEIKDASGNPTGYYKQHSKTVKSIYGSFLDNENNFLALKNHIETLTHRKYHCIFTDHKEIIELISEFAYSSEILVESFFEGFLQILSKIGYINTPYIPHLDKTQLKDGERLSIEFIVTPKDGSDEDAVRMFLYAMDDYCYKVI